MSKELMVVTDGTFVLSETERKGEFVFSRKDGGTLGEVGNLPIEFYQEYVARKRFDGERYDNLANNVSIKSSIGGTCLVLITNSKREEINSITATKNARQKKLGYVRRMMLRIIS